MRYLAAVSFLALLACGSEPSETPTASGGSGTAVDSGTCGTCDDMGSPVSGSETGLGSGEESGLDTGSTGAGSDTGETEPDPRQVLLETYAPRIWFSSEESYWPSSVQWAFPQLERFSDAEGQYWVRSIEPLDSPSDTLPFFAGQLDDAPIYGYWADKGGGIVDLVYFVYCPYNRGKSVLDTIWGNHVGDWEHITVRLLRDPEGAYSASQIYLSAHNFGGAYDFGGGEIELFEGTHPVVYSASGSHGFWAQPGDHVYASFGETDPVFDICVTLVCVDLVDRCAADLVWDTWEQVQGMDFFAQQGLEATAWPSWMNDDFTDPGKGDPALPGMGPIYRWGNPEDCSVLGVPVDVTDILGICRLENGPTGPLSKSTWGPELR